MDNQIFNQSSSSAATPVVANPLAPVIYAGFWRRFFASAIDGVFTGFIGGIVGFLTGQDFIISISVGAIVGMLYTSVFDSSELMGSPGKALLDMAVVNEKDFSRLSFKTAVVRFFCKYISGLCLLIGYLIQPFTEKRQTLHDIMTATVVIRKSPGQINYFKAYKNNFNSIINN